MHIADNPEFFEVVLPNATIDGALLGIAVGGFRKAAGSLECGRFARSAAYGVGAALAAFIAIDRTVDRRNIMRTNPELLVIARDESRRTFSRYDDLDRAPNYPPAL
ncbi:MAG TPA: hypothetical protein VFI84_00190 [Candidatus Saccharimonadales bacterium]|nr:hypothetical protein [Candidatus Saccharimonadales bacterium]